LFIAVFISNFLDEFATKYKSQSSSGFFRFIVGGAWLSLMDKNKKIDSIAPAAPRTMKSLILLNLQKEDF
jgi:hypothetical protein